MSYGGKKQCTASDSIRIRIFEPKRFLRRAVDISAKTALIIAAAIWLSGGVFRSAADTANNGFINAEMQVSSNGEDYSVNTAAEDKVLTNGGVSDDGTQHNKTSNADAESTAADDGFLNPTSGVLTSNFGTRRGRLHSGIDIGADTGNEIYAAKSGRIIFSGMADGYGNYVKIDHGNGLTTAYGHCSVLAVSEGDEVKKGQVIAYVGSTGNSTGPHLHFEVKLDGEFKNPLDYVVY